ncbi:DUF3307 domain-containing protein [Salimicrobium halophilum]|uniref:DUF3307 domain-containing protein n=1 Tax=Salimicrobium halophilum TaxID=86666 RepID=A0A1G8UY90_9BACI|nr:DUF3307 domain-containing protein [Salimicrobium halophilum]SDJ58065.1 Protein of unknown function [Salimicrobium halophilum]
MSPFSYMLIGHLFGDYLFQTKWMAIHKADQWPALLVHSTVYTLFVLLACLWGGVDVGWLGFAFIWGTHVFLDRRGFVTWWSRTIMRNKDPEIAWLCIIVDQVFHIFVLALVLHYQL